MRPRSSRDSARKPWQERRNSAADSSVAVSSAVWWTWIPSERSASDAFAMLLVDPVANLVGRAEPEALAGNRAAAYPTVS